MEKKLYFAPETVVTDINMEEIMQQVSAGEIPVSPDPIGDDEDATAKSAFSVWDE
ncbi:MAG: hypothetical protein IJL54_08680 [Prevotella sp.]|nr:hypothetical protein [Prevotella sp.]